MKRKEVFKILCVMLVTFFIVSPVVAGLSRKNISTMRNDEEEINNEGSNGAEFEIKKIGILPHFNSWWAYVDTYFYCSVKNSGDEPANTYIQVFMGPVFPPRTVNYEKRFATGMINPGETVNVKIRTIEDFHGSGGFYYLRCVANPQNYLEEDNSENNIMTRIFYVESNYAIPLFTVPSLG